MQSTYSQRVIGARDPIPSGYPETGVTASPSDSAAIQLIGTGIWFCLLTLVAPGIAASPVSLSLTPRSAALRGSQTQQFTATMWGASNRAVTWTLSPALGTISAAGYTAPATIAAAQTVTVRATSVADSTKAASATVTLAPTVTISLAPSSAALTGSQSQQFTATVRGAVNRAVTWTLSPAVGTISAAGLYAAPATIAAAQTVTVKATSLANPTQSASATVTLAPPITIVVSPLSAALTASQTQQFTSTVGGTSNTEATWTLSPTVGTISALGLYTAPATIAAAQTVTVTVISAADSTKSASATVTLNPPVTVSLTPFSVSLQPSQNQTFTATVSGSSNTGVTWSFSPALGSLASGTTTAVYIAPSTAPTTQSVTVTASSMADSSKTATAAITLPQAVTVSLSPSTVSLAVSSTQQFTATVLGTSNTAVTWSIDPSVGTIFSAGLYTAPASVPTSQTVTVTARSVADPTTSASATISLSPPIGTFTYYVDSVNGADSNPGTLAAPWQMIAKVNSTTLLPGQSVAFKAGDVWREQLVVSSSGKAASPIIFGAYGIGAPPVIDGADLVLTWTSSSLPNVYIAAVANQPNQVFVGGLRIAQGTSQSALAGNQWFWSAGTLYLYDSSGNPGGKGVSIAAAQRNSNVDLNSKNYVVIQDLALLHANENGIFCSGDCIAPTLQGNSISYAFGDGVRNNSNATWADSVITANTIDHSGASGIALVTPGVTNNLISGNTLHHNSQIYSSVGDHGFSGGLYFWTVGSGNIVAGNTSYDNGVLDSGALVSASAPIGMGFWFDTVSPGNTLTRNVSYSNSYNGIQFEDTSGCALTYNVAYANVNTSNYANGISVNSYNQIAATSGNLIANNVAYGNYWGVQLTGYSNGAAGEFTGNVFENNIVYASVGGLELSALYGAENDGQMGFANVYSNNIIGPAGSGFIGWGAHTSFGTLTAWQSASGAATNSAANPLFVGPTLGNFALQVGSPAIGAGVYIPGVSAVDPPNIGAQ
jgi:hypothetical protein